MFLIVHPYYPIISYTFFFFFNDTATTEIYTLSLHDALPIYSSGNVYVADQGNHAIRKITPAGGVTTLAGLAGKIDRKSTRLNSSHSQISYAVFCLKKKKKKHMEWSHRHTNEESRHYALLTMM